MAIIAADGFDHYGVGATSRTNMLKGIYADVNANFSIETTQPRTGIRALGSTSLTSGDIWRRVLSGSPRTQIGFGVALYLSDLPDNNNLFIAGQLRDAANAELVTLTVLSTGALRVHIGDESGSAAATSSANDITALAYNHIEMFVVFNGASGTVEVRVNGVTVINSTGINFGFTGAQMFAAGTGGAISPGVSQAWWDDWYIYDNSGSNNNAIGVGDIKLKPLYATADTTVSDWTRNTGPNDFEAIDETTPNDDTDYIASSAVNDESEFNMTNTDADTESVKFLASYVYARKDDAGDASIQQGAGSANIGSPPAAAESFGDTHALTTVYAYYADIIETDPATGSLWTPAAVDDARMIIKRVA